MIEDFFVHDVTRLRAPLATTRGNNQFRDWDSEDIDEEPMKGWFVQIDSTEDEDTPGRDARIIDAHLDLPAGSDVEATDRFEHEGTTYTIEGDPNRAQTPDGEHHVSVDLRRTEG